MLSKINPLKTGIIGAIIAALCCFTPILVILLGVVGFSALTGYLDYVLFPALAFFIGLTLYGLWRNNNKANAQHACCTDGVICEPATTEPAAPKSSVG
ncbi:MAG: mercury resistance system transport protein MerF [Chloroflexi bacterium]|nr:MAG: mercury resistance system transport protein MerF [Chloroflexota bacterium]